MITGSEEYKQYFAQYGNSSNTPCIRIRVPKSEPVYQIDWNTRTVEAPEFVAVEADHVAEIIYFEMDRYYDLMDLSQCVGLIQFKNARNEEFFYVIPYYDIDSKEDKIIFAWAIQAPVTKYGGTIQFSFKFFKANASTGELIYELNTTVAKTKVLVGWANKNGADHTYNTLDASQLVIDNELMNAIVRIKEAADQLHVYWIDV